MEQHLSQRWIRLFARCTRDVIGSSRGGKNTKVHVLLNERMQLLKVKLTGGHIHDSEPALDKARREKFSRR